jgi:large subunit ribosomal protein L15
VTPLTPAGRRILFLRSSLALLGEQRRATKVDDPWGRETFQHPSLEGLPNLASIDINKALGKERLSSLAVSCGIDQVARWNPRYPLDLKASGCEIVYASCLCAIVGAISLERGGQYVNKVVSGAILQPLGIERS